MRREVLAGVLGVVLFGAAAGGFAYYNQQQLKPFDADEWLAKSYQTARAQHPDAKAFEVTAEAITSDGRVHLEQRGGLTVRFHYSQAASAAPTEPIPGSRVAPLGGVFNVPGRECPGGRVITTKWGSKGGGHFEHEWREGTQKCLHELDGPPKCTFQQIWQKAKAKGAPDPAYADIDLAEDVGSGAEKRWRFEIVNHTDFENTTVFHAEFPDDC